MPGLRLRPSRKLLSVAATTLVTCSVSVIAARQLKPTFEVASVKPQSEPVAVTGAANAMPRAKPGGVFNPTHATVEHLLMFAYDLRPNRILGGPKWLREEAFEINARAGADVPESELKLMVQSLLEERFHAVMHVETRQVSYQALVLARSDGTVGPNVIGVDSCAADYVNNLRRTSPDRFPRPSDDPSIAAGMAGCTSPGLTTLAALLSTGSNTPMVDATGLTGSFYYTLTSRFSAVTALLGVPSSRENDPNLPALPTALREQLGVRLETRTGPLDVLVIESVQRPAEN